jgi:hypothetical protein
MKHAELKRKPTISIIHKRPTNVSNPLATVYTKQKETQIKNLKGLKRKCFLEKIEISTWNAGAMEKT